MERRWQRGGAHHIAAPVGATPCDRVVPVNCILHAKPRIEVNQVRAAAHENMLAVVEHAPAHPVFETGSASSKPPPRLEHDWPISGVTEPQRRCKPREAPANDNHIIAHGDPLRDRMAISIFASFDIETPGTDVTRRGEASMRSSSAR